MDLQDLIERFGTSRERREKAIFSTLFFAGNRLQTIFDRQDPQVTLRQFMLLTMLRQAGGELTLTKLGALMGCSRQNVRKLAAALERKGFVRVAKSESDTRAASVVPTERLAGYFEGARARHGETLERLFAEYTDEEVERLFSLLAKLYHGIDRLERNPETDAEKSVEGAI